MSKTRRRPTVILDAGYVSIRANDRWKSSKIIGLHGIKLFCVIVIVLILFFISCINLTVSQVIEGKRFFFHSFDFLSVLFGLCINLIGHHFIKMVRKYFVSIKLINKSNSIIKLNFKKQFIQQKSMIYHQLISPRTTRLIKNFRHMMKYNVFFCIYRRISMVNIIRFFLMVIKSP